MVLDWSIRENENKRGKSRAWFIRFYGYSLKVFDSICAVEKQCTLLGKVVFDRPAVFDFSRISPAAENCCSSFSQTSRSKIAGYWLSPFALMATPQTHHERVELMLLLLSVLVLCCCTVVLVLWQDGWMDAAAAQLWLCVCVWAVAPTFHILLSNQFLCSAQKCNQISLFMHHHHTFNDAACYFV